VSSPTLHSSFSASSSARLLACPGSYALGLAADDGTRRSSVYSAQGTLAHAVAEACIHTGLDPYSFVGQTRSADGFEFTIDDEFAEATDMYVSYVRTFISLGYVVALEQRVSPQVHWGGLAPLDVDLFGTSDCVAYHPGSKTLAIGDLKFGRGVAVNAVGNSQLRYYGAGSAHPSVLEPLCRSDGVTFEGVDRVELTIIQPRAFHPDGPVRRDVLTYDDLREWARTDLYDGVKRALEDNGQTLAAGDHCRFCPVLAACEKPEELSRAVAAAAFSTPAVNTPAAVPFDDLLDPDAPDADLPGVHISDAKLADLLDKIELLEPWMRALRALAQERMEAGTSVPGWKVVPKRALRRWADDAPEEVLSALAQAGLHEDDYSVTKPLSPAQVERKVGRKTYEAAVAPLVVKTSSGNTIASDGDPRARVRAARTGAEAFGLEPPTEEGTSHG
jgi:hypothetical protein